MTTTHKFPSLVDDSWGEGEEELNLGRVGMEGMGGGEHSGGAEPVRKYNKYM